MGLIETSKREILRLLSRKIYLWAMLIIPIGCACFFLSLMHNGLPIKVPVAVVDLDNSTLSRQITTNLNSSQDVEIRHYLNSYHEAIDQINAGNIFGFILIPNNLEQESFNGHAPTLTYYSNMTYYIPGTLSFKGFKTIAISTTSTLVKEQLTSLGLNNNQANSLLQPLAIQEHLIGNPWINYSVYLCNSFIPAIIALMVMLVTSFSICEEIKQRSSIKWINDANNSIHYALLGKLLPHTLIFSIVGIFILLLFYGFNHFPIKNSFLIMIGAMIMLIISCQAFALIICCILPNLRLALSVVSLLGILSFSITGFSFPLEDMYGSIAIFSHIIPVRYYFLIYIDQALNGISLYYSQWYFIALCIFPLIPLSLLWRLKRACLNPVYVP